MSFSPQLLLQRLQRLPAPRRYLVAFSGGCDSTALLDAMARLRDRIGIPLSAIHVDHGLNPASAAWAARCEAFCRDREVPLEVRRLDLRPAAGSSVEAVAREQRYLALQAAMNTGDAVVTAHQRDDQAETFLLLLMRGAGPRGLAGMPEARPFGRGLLLRPLLDFGRCDLEAYVRASGLQWIEDDSNRDARFDRNYLRQEVLPALVQRWPAAVPLIARATSYCAEADDAVRTLAIEDVAAASTGGVLEVAGMVALSDARRRSALRQWLYMCGLPLPDHRRLEEIARQLQVARPDALPLVTWPGAEVRRWRGGLYAGELLPPAPSGTSLEWVEGREFYLPADLGSLLIEGPAPVPPLEIRFRRGGETCRIRGKDRRLKKLLQEQGVPPWLRSRLPLVFRQGTLVALGDLLFCDGWPASLGMTWKRGRGWQDCRDSPIHLRDLGSAPNRGCASCQVAGDPI